MKLLLVLITIIIIVFVFKQTTKQLEEDEAKGIKFKEFGAKFLGGLPDVEGNKKVDIILNKTKLELYINGREKSIPVHSIKNAEIKTNQQIANEVSLGKLLVFGIFALGMKNEKTIIKNYVDVTFNDNGTNRDIILESTDNEGLVRQLRGLYS